MGASTAAWLPHMSSFVALKPHCCLNKKPLFVDTKSIRTSCILPRQSFSSSSILTFARRRGGHQASSSPVKSKKQKKKEQTFGSKSTQEDEDDDAFEALFRQLEEDLKNDNLSSENGDDDDEISEEDLAKLERELEEALKDDELFGALDLVGDGKTEDESDEDEKEEDNEDDNTANYHVEDLEDDDNDEEMPVKLKNWQLKRLAYALKNGRRKTNIKSLAADLCLDRAVVLELLRDPPPDLLMMSAALPDKPVSTVVEPVNKLKEACPLEMTPVTTKAEAEVKVPVHVMQSNWSAKKRIKKAQLDTLERVYNRTKRPSNAMISNIVHLTNLPKKRVVKWFEDKRAEDGIPEHRLPASQTWQKLVFLKNLWPCFNHTEDHMNR
nr:protein OVEREXPRESSOR OF CATIONIC PEROXIDASE 3-like isoform X1 [Coffea arabica]XP_027083145.1 protein OVEREXPRESSOR OF CATIONIC PEROXIDASE 3-like isoform X1 [Coffea arabica]